MCLYTAPPVRFQHRGRAQERDPGGQADRPQAHHGGRPLGEDRGQGERKGEGRGEEREGNLFPEKWHQTEM